MDSLNYEARPIAVQEQESHNGCDQSNIKLGTTSENRLMDADSDGNNKDIDPLMAVFLEMRQRTHAAFASLVEDGIVGAYCLKCGLNCGVYAPRYSADFLTDQVIGYVSWCEKNHKHSRKGRTLYSSPSGISKLSNVPMGNHMMAAMEKSGLKVERIQGHRRRIRVSLTGSLSS